MNTGTVRYNPQKHDRKREDDRAFLASLPSMRLDKLLQVLSSKSEWKAVAAKRELARR